MNNIAFSYLGLHSEECIEFEDSHYIPFLIFINKVIYYIYYKNIINPVIYNLIINRNYY